MVYTTAVQFHSQSKNAAISERSRTGQRLHTGVGENSYFEYFHAEQFAKPQRRNNRNHAELNLRDT